MSRRSVATIGMIGGFLYGETDNKKEYDFKIIAKPNEEEMTYEIDEDDEGIMSYT